MKFITTTIATILLFTTAACGKTNDNNKKTENMKAIHLTVQEFKDKVYNYDANPNAFTYRGNLPAIVDFYASWCGPCKALAPVLDELAAEYAGKVLIYKVNVEEEEELAAQFGIRSIPTLLFIPTNNQPQMAQGAMPKATLKNAIDNLLLNNK